MNQVKNMKRFLENNKRVLIRYLEQARKVSIDLMQKKENDGCVWLGGSKFSTKKLCAKDILNLESQEFKELFYYEIIEICDMYNEFVRERGLFDDTLAIKKIECGMESPWTMHNTIKDGGIIEWYGRRYRLSEIKD